MINIFLSHLERLDKEIKLRFPDSKENVLSATQPQRYVISITQLNLLNPIAVECNDYISFHRV